MEIIKAFVIGITEGITEWLPISSTGHMILLNEFIRLDVSEDFWELFLVVVQLGAIMAVIVLFRDRIFPFGFSGGRLRLRKDAADTWAKVLTAALPAAVLGILLDDWLDEHLFRPEVVAAALIVYGIWFLFLEKRGRHERYAVNDVAHLSFKTAFGIGLFQVLSLIPGTSRSGSTIIGGMVLGTSRPVAAEFTFWMAVPVMAGASLLKLLKFGTAFGSDELAILAAGCVSAFFVSLVSIKFLMGYVKSRDFRVFGWYRIVLGTIVLLYSFIS